MNFKKYVYSIFLSALFLFTGCIRRRTIQLPQFEWDREEQNRHDIYVAKKDINLHESRKVFGYYSANKISKKKLQSVLLYIQNNSNKTYILDSDNIGIDLQDPSFLVSGPKKAMFGYVLAGTLIGVCSTIMLTFPLVTFLFTSKYTNIFFLPAVGIWLTPTIVFPSFAGAKVASENRKAKRDLKSKIFSPQDKIVVGPYQIYTILMLVKRTSYDGSFSLKLKGDGFSEIREFLLK